MSEAQHYNPLERLHPFIGIWDTEGIVEETSSGRRHVFKATDTYEWIAGGYFLLHRFDAKLPDGHLIRVEIIGFDQRRNQYALYSFDSQGHSHVLFGDVEDDSWLFVGEYTLISGGFRDDNNVFAGLIERRDNPGSDWSPWMEVTLHKVA